MNKERIKKLAENPNFIPGIYNYCDRWCERCPFTCRCMNFALSEEQFGNSQARDINDEAFWARLSEIFQATLEMLKETAKQEGIDLDSIDLQATLDDEKATDRMVASHECSRAAKTYGKMVENWFESAKEAFEKKADELNLTMQLELPDSDPDGQAAELKDAVDIIRWYQYQIYVKLLRAIKGLHKNSQSPDEIHKIDANGSAKVALIGIDRSEAAWGQIYKHFPQREGDVLEILVHLDRLRRKTETSFPDARAFVRQGFDT